ncbi:DUF4177 domain-containing protein [Serpentinicella sp. ANB-PHB4]|uniref:DUF4177 domain-containing protein n=1 Tax=Serpentinicella sp. ANB-PHB4 TaxID=3074076 RepID=UPI00285E67FD|nr:DUF4177 domain-containing protein [Serpentinicella sp. ANB-PHB4]MDR5659990.1 DUF4177 domain-containing protein [Serpentinicella sp. ANB-PHB4]
MFEYKFIKVEVKGFLTLAPKEDYHSIVEKHAREGWRLVQIFAPPVGSYGVAKYLELIFEKQN